MNNTRLDTGKIRRHRTEKKLRLDRAKTRQPTSLIDAQKQLHVLLVHQIELEIQNEELERKQSELESALALYELAPIGYLILNEKGLIQEANLAATAMLGMARDALRKKLISQLISPDNKEVYDLHKKRLIETGELQNWEMCMVRADGTPFWAHLHATSLHNGDLGITLTNITKRKQVEDQLLESEDRYRSLFESSTDAILLTVPDGTILAVNSSTCRMFERTEEEIKQIGRSGIMDTSDPRLSLAIAERNQFGFILKKELTSIRKNGERFLVELSSTIFKDKEGNARTSMIIRDITERKQLEEVSQNDSNRINILIAKKTAQLSDTLARLTSSEHFKQTIIDSLPANIAVIDQKGLITATNRPWLEFGQKNGLSDEMCNSVGTNYLAACNKIPTLNDSDMESARSAFQGITSVLEGRKTSFVMDYPCHSPAEKRWYQMTVMRPEAEFEGAVISHIDISNIKHHEEDRRFYILHLAEVIEQERLRTARELHDDIGQKLTLLSFAVCQIKNNTRDKKQSSQALLDMQAGVDSMIESIRRICTNLRPAILDELGLPSALEWLSKDFTHQSGIPCRFTFNGDCCDNRECSMIIFRIVQESLNNIMKHAGASKADITLFKNNDTMCVEISDDGCGFKASMQPVNRSFGLIGMRERANSLGATFDITSNKDKGTCVKLIVPCKRSGGNR